MRLVRSTRARGSVGFSRGIRSFAVVCRATQEVEALAEIRPVLSARGDGGGVCGGLGRRQLDRAFCSAIAVSSVGFFAPVLLLGRTVRPVRVWVVFRNPCRVQSLHAGPIGALWDQAVCCIGAVASVGYFCSALVAGPNCASRGRCGRFSWFLEVVCRLNERSVVAGAIRCDERDDRDCGGR